MALVAVYLLNKVVDDILKKETEKVINGDNDVKKYLIDIFAFKIVKQETHLNEMQLIRNAYIEKIYDVTYEAVAAFCHNISEKVAHKDTSDMITYDIVENHLSTFIKNNNNDISHCER